MGKVPAANEFRFPHSTYIQKMGMVASTCNPITWQAVGGVMAEDHKFETIVVNIMTLYLRAIPRI